jgi:hypothetical protein
MPQPHAHVVPSPQQTVPGDNDSDGAVLCARDATACRSAARLEWTALWLIAKDENGVVSKEKVGRISTLSSNCRQ